MLAGTLALIRITRAVDLHTHPGTAPHTRPAVTGISHFGHIERLATCPLRLFRLLTAQTQSNCLPCHMSPRRRGVQRAPHRRSAREKLRCFPSTAHALAARPAPHRTSRDHAACLSAFLTPTSPAARSPPPSPPELSPTPLPLTSPSPSRMGLFKKKASGSQTGGAGQARTSPTPQPASSTPTSPSLTDKDGKTGTSSPYPSAHGKKASVSAGSARAGDGSPQLPSSDDPKPPRKGKKDRVNAALEAGGDVSRTTVHVGGLPVNMFGWDELTPLSSGRGASASASPRITIVLHMHGRTGSASKSEGLVRQLYDRIRKSKLASQAQTGQQSDFLVCSFDQRNHGHRKTSEIAQKAWKEGNKSHAVDLYAMYDGTARDVSFLLDYLPAYLFPHDERQVTTWAVTGQSLGGHAVWHVLQNEPRVRIGVPMIGMPDISRLLARRTASNFVPNAPPAVPGHLRAHIARTDPAAVASANAAAAAGAGGGVQPPNPYWGKKILVLSGQDDRLVRWEYSAAFVDALVVDQYGSFAHPNPACPRPPPGQGPQPGVARPGLDVVIQPGVGHAVTPAMVDRAAEWIWYWGLVSHQSESV